MIDRGRGWFDWRAGLIERLDRLADVLELHLLISEELLLISEELLGETQSWFCASREEAWRPPYASEVRPTAADAPKSSPLTSSSEPREVGMRSIDDIIADAQKSLGHSLREAFDAGRDHVASELKRRMAGLFEELAGGASSATGEHVQPATHEGHHPEHGHG